LQLATRRAAEAERARQHARADLEAAADQTATLAGRWWGRRDLPAARERLVLAEHALRTTTGQADQAAERLGLLRRAQQRHLGWLEAHDTELRVQERAVAREDAWRRRVDQHALALDPPGWLLARTRPHPHRPAGAEGVAPGRRGAGRLPARAYGLDDPRPAKHRWGRVARDGRPAAAATRPAAEAADRTRPPGRHGRGEPAHRRDDRGQPPALVAGQQHRVDRSGCWAPSPAGRPPAAAATGRPPRPPSSGWPAGAATAPTATSPIPTGPTATGPAAAWTPP
jgi:hypothetical protein